MTTVTALYVDPRGVYANLPGVEVWDEARDARLYAGPWPVVAHPPCNHWCLLAPVNAKRYDTFEIGADGGCFGMALRAVRTFGGVLEHPGSSLAWAKFDLPIPTRYRWQSRFGDPGWATEISQSAYGHPARKRTWLYAVGVDLESIVLRWWDEPGEGVIGGGINTGECVGRPKISKREAAATPPAFRDVLLAMARSARPLEPFVSPQYASRP